MHHVAVSENETIRCENESRATPSYLIWRLTTLTTALSPGYLNIDNRRTHSFRSLNNRARIRIEHPLVSRLRRLQGSAFNHPSFIIYLSCNCVPHLYLLV